MAAKASPPSETEAAPSRLARSLQSAVVMGDSHGVHLRAAQILDAALERDQETAPASDLVEALAYRAELALRADDHATASSAIARARAITLSRAESAALAETLTQLDDFAALAEGRAPV